MKKKTHEEFVKEVYDLVGDEYSVLGEYIGANTHILMKHNTCNHEWDIKPSNFLSGKRCPECNHPTYDINKARKLFKKVGFTLLATEYTGIFDNMPYICDTHPDLGIQYASLTGINQGHTNCPKCRYEKTANSQKEDFEIVKALFKLHNLKLLDTQYINCKQQLHYICNNHPNEGIQTITYDALKNSAKFACKRCAYEYISDIKRMSDKDIKSVVESKGFELIEIIKEKHTKIKYICPKHRNKGIQTKLLYDFTSEENGHGCIYCSGMAQITNQEFIERMYNLNSCIKIKSKYINHHSDIDCECSECGYKWTNKASNLMYGDGNCPNCGGSKGERKIRDILNKYGIQYQREYSFNDLVSDNNVVLRYDFALLNNVGIYYLIEYDGIGHYEPVDFNGKGKMDAEKIFKDRLKYDNRKNDYAENHNIPLLRIPYWDFDNIEKILDREFHALSINLESA